MLTWAEQPERPLGDLLRQRGNLDENRVNALKCLVSAHLRQNNGDLGASLDAWNAQALTQDVLTQLENTAPGSTLGATLGATLAFTGTRGDGAGFSLRAELPSFTQEQRFELIRPHAKGGIGQVWLARDRELQRDVAVKEIQSRYVDREGLRARFLLEAEITGNLEHPGIIPVYSLGRNAEGRPFYAMRFIRGETLSLAIKQFHEKRIKQAETGEVRSGVAWGVEFQQLLRRFLDVCDAMEYAHSRGVIHRDLKPGNIMLGPYGETLVVDWGLAKVVGQSDIVATHTESGDGGDFDPGTTGLTATIGGETQPGTTIGTPSYMSPEQARGEIGDLGPASDVYSLGATLYELISGSMPFVGKRVPEIIAEVKEGKLAPPRTVLPSIPPPLESICLKAMAFKPEDRYRSARDLASDLEHWMADEPVGAYPEQRLQRVSRWLRRHRTWTYAAAAALIGIIVVATIALFVLNDARGREAAARGEAEANFKMALNAVDNFLTNVSENTLIKEQETHDVRTLREALLKSALPFYEEFVHKRSDDPQLREQLANAYFRLGDITKVIGSSQDALNYYRYSLNLWTPLADSDPGNLDFQKRLADCDAVIGRLIGSEDLPESLVWLNRALKIYEQIATKRPTDARFQSSLADCCSDVALCLTHRKDVVESLKYLNQARTILLTLVASHDDNIEYKKGLAEIVNRMGIIDSTRGDYSAAREHYQEFQQIARDILDDVKAGPKPQNYQDMMARSYFNIAATYPDRKDAQRSLEASGKAAEYWSKLVDVAPSVTSYQVDLGKAYYQMAWTEHQLGREADALASAERALKIFNRLIEAEPENLEHQVQKGSVLNHKGVIHDEARRNDLANQTLREAVQIRRSILRKSSGIDDRKYDLCVSLENLGETCVDRGDVDEGLSHYRDAVGLRQELSASHPGDRGYVTDLADAWVVIGNIQRQKGDPKGARESYDHANALIEPLLKSDPNDSELQSKAGRVLERRANVLDDEGQPEAAMGLLRRAADLARGALTSTSQGGRAREVLSESLWNLARLLRGAGQDKEAGRVDDERKSLWKKRPAAELIELARMQAVRADVVGYGKTPISPAGERVRTLDRDQAAGSIKDALTLGFNDLAVLSTNPDIAPLLERADVKPLISVLPRHDKP